MLVKKILSYFPPTSEYDAFIDACSGGGSVILNSPYVPIRIYNDLEKNVYSLHAVLQHRHEFVRFKERAELSLYDEETWKHYKEELKRFDIHYTDRAFYYWYVNRTSVNGIGGFSSTGIHIRKGLHYTLRKMHASIERLDEIHEILQTIIVTNRDIFDLIPKWDNDRVFIYIDVPYVLSTRNGKAYIIEWSDEDHKKLINMLLEIKNAKILLSGYDNQIYKELENNKWRKESFQANSSSAAGISQSKTECVWMNY